MRKTLLLFVALALLACQARAFNPAFFNGTGPNLFWNLTNTPVSISTNLVNRSTRALRFFLASDGYSATNTANELNAVRASFAQWQSIPGTTVLFEEGGLLPPWVDMIDPNDQTNIVYWVKYTNKVEKGLASIAGVLGSAYLSFQSDGTLVGSDILLNGASNTWFADFSSKADTNYFVESVMLHEIGHALGMAHASIGGATMLANAQTGIDSGAGLSPDEVAFARATYPKSNILATLGRLQGTVTKNGSNVFGAAIIVEDAVGNLLGSTITRTNGTYQMPALPLGTHHVRVCPLDPANASFWLIQGLDVDLKALYQTVDTSFLPSTNNVSVTLTAGATNALNFAVVAGDPAFRITWIRSPETVSGQYHITALPALLYPGQSNRVMGVFSQDLPANGATVTITGDGLTLGTNIYEPGTIFGGLNGISWSISVATNATPGLRTIIVNQGTNFAYANGFLEIVPNHPDYNFDGLDDIFQRAYFPLFTDSSAGPNADPDGDGMVNSAEYIAGTSPTNAASLLKVETATQTASGTTVTWRSVAGKSYQVSSRADFGAASWQPVGSPVSATNVTARVLDATATNGMRFYRVQVLP